MPIPLAIPIVGGLLAATAGGLLIRKEILKSKGAAVATPASIAALPPAVQKILATPGPPPSQAAINSLQQELANGTLDPTSFAKGTNGQLFVFKSPDFAGGGVIPDDQVVQIQVGDTATIDVGRAGISNPAVPSGNLLTVVQFVPNMQTRTIQVVTADPRVPGETTLVVPIESITGLG